ncbi:MAG TPA: DEAD/DEAH box helicase [Chloroflexota bacterium]|nr:DEAD/DEAH box helicase [Chloroflexota bacterium]
MSATFAELGLSAPLLRAVAELGYEEPTPIQQQAIGPLLAGRDLVGQAQTGTGKTAAFALPMLERLRAGVPQPQGLVLVPTRELAIQNAEAIHALGRYTGARVLPIYGGQSIERQLRVLQRGVDIVVGTPGRVLDHLRRGTLSLAAVRMAVLDEADEMLAMGFIEDVEAILEQVPTERQTALFSATIPPRLAELARRFLREPLWVSVVRDKLTVPQTRQVYYEVLSRGKLDALTRILDVEMPTSAIIFTRTKRDAAELADQLIGLGYQAEPLHGDLSQAERDRTMRRFREGAVELLVATDVAARGLDIPEVSHVINYDVPADPEVYVHRIGRTGRAGRKGEAITLVTPRERRALHLIERLTKGKLKPARLPTAADVAARRREALKETLRTMVAAGDLEPYLLVVEELAAEHDVAEIAAAALKLTGELETRGNGAATPEPAPREVFPEDGLSAEPGMTKLFLSLGRADGLRPNDIVGAIANEAGLPGKAIGAIDLYDRFSLVQVPKKDAHRVLAALQRTTLRGRRVHAEIARPRRR